MMSVAIRKARPEGKTCSDLGLGQGPAVVRGVLTKSGSSRPLGRRAGVEERDEGQISKLLRRLEGHGLLANTGGQTLGAPYAWHLTPRGVEALRAGESAGSAL